MQDSRFYALNSARHWGGRHGAALSEAEQAFLAAAPVWYTGALAAAGFGGALGSLALLSRKRWALWHFLASFVAGGPQLSYCLLLSGMGAGQDAGSLTMTIMIQLIAGTLIWFAVLTTGRGWLSWHFQQK